MVQELLSLRIQWLCNLRQAALDFNDSCALSSSPTFDSLGSLQISIPIVGLVEQLFNSVLF